MKSYAQIEAADKQLRSMRKFQEEQANERELERDEASKQVQMLQERLREREREKDRDYRITSAEVRDPIGIRRLFFYLFFFTFDETCFGN